MLTASAYLAEAYAMTKLQNQRAAHTYRTAPGAPLPAFAHPGMIPPPRGSAGGRNGGRSGGDRQNGAHDEADDGGRPERRDERRGGREERRGAQSAGSRANDLDDVPQTQAVPTQTQVTQSQLMSQQAPLASQGESQLELNLDGLNFGNMSQEDGLDFKSQLASQDPGPSQDYDFGGRRLGSGH